MSDTERFGPYPPPFEDHHNPAIRVQEESVEMFRLLTTHVQRAISDELEKRDIRPGTAADLHCEAVQIMPSRINLIFRIQLLGPDDHRVEFRGAV